jgi:hypothetical protein
MKNVITRFLAALGSILALAILLQLVAPHAVHAVVSTLVTVANTTANPVPVHSVDPATPFLPFQASGSCFSEEAPCTASQFFSVPAGFTAVAQDVSGNCILTNFGTVPPPPPRSLVLTSFSGAGSLSNGTVELGPVFENSNTVNGSFTSTGATYTFGRAAILYAASNSSGQGSFSFSVTPGSLGAACTVNISGYYVQNPVAPSAE